MARFSPKPSAFAVARDALSSYVSRVGSLEPLSRDHEVREGRALREAEREHALTLLRAPIVDAVLAERLADEQSVTGESRARLARLIDAAAELGRAPTARRAEVEAHAWDSLQAVDGWRGVVAHLDRALSRAAGPGSERLLTLARQALEARRRADAARQTLLEAHLRLVISEAKRFVGRGVPLPDLVQEGNIGLIDAADRFDPELGYRFNTYAMWWIRAKLRGTVARHGRTIRVPVRRLQAVSRLHRAEREAASELGRTPTAAEVGERVDLPADEVERLLELPAEPLRLEGLDAAGDGASIADRLADPHAVDPLDALVESGREDLARTLMGTLSDREARIIEDRFGFRASEHTLDEIGRKMGVTRERIRQIEARALRKMRVLAERADALLPAEGRAAAKEPAPAAARRT